MIIVTGAAGFIGSVFLWKLNQEGIDKIIAVDSLDDSSKEKNLADKKIKDYIDKNEFLKLILENKFSNHIDAVFHLGACSSTTETNEKYLMENNYQYSIHMCEYALKNKARFIYASSAATYGDGALGYDDDPDMIEKLKPLNLYGRSKQLFDEWILQNRLYQNVVGLKYFNVFGPNEYHKGDMRSVIAKSYPIIAEEKVMKLFKSYNKDYKDGEQKRDFIYVKDAVDMTYHFFENRSKTGIYNIGTGKAHSWNELASAIFQAMELTLNIEYIDMPEAIRPNYQYFTEAKTEKLLKSGYQKPCMPLEESIKDYIGFLKEKKVL